VISFENRQLKGFPLELGIGTQVRKKLEWWGYQMIENVLRLIHSNANELSASLPSVTNNHFLCNVNWSICQLCITVSIEANNTESWF